MSVVAITLLVFAVGDMLAGHTPGRSRAAGAAIVSAALAVTVAYLAGIGGGYPWLAGVAIGWTVAVWLAFKHESTVLGTDTLAAARWQLLWILAVVVLTLALSGSFPEVDGPIANWYANLPLGAGKNADATQVLLGIASLLFLLSTTNRIVRLTLTAVGAKLEAGEETLKGGRYIGAIERIIVAGLICAGSLDGAGLVIAAKGFIRLPEIRSAAEQRLGAQDSVAEYFLIGTLTSILVASALAGLILAAG